MIDIEKRIQWYKTNLTKLSDLVDKGRLTPQERTEAQAILKRIKSNFQEDVRVANSVRMQATLTPEEKEYYTVVHEASTRLRVKTNSDPIRAHWSEELYDCFGDFDFYLQKHQT